MKPRLWLALFVMLQMADGVLTYAAVERFGASAEGNPLLATWILMAGAAPALLGAKLMACACGGRGRPCLAARNKLIVTIF